MGENDQVARLNLYDLVLLLLKWRKLFIVNFFLVITVSAIIAMVLPVWYSANTVILPSSGSSGGLPSFLPSDLKGVATSFGFDSASEEIYETILASRTILERIAKKFDLRTVYKMDEEAFHEDVLKALAAHLSVETRDDGSISIKVEDQSAERSAEMANFCVEELDHIFSQITSETARKNKLFIGMRLEQVNDSLAKLQDRLKRFQEENNAISISDQLMIMINAAADLKAEQLANEVELEVVRSAFGVNHPYFKQLASADHIYEENFNDLIEGKTGDVFLSLKELPALGQQFADLMRRVRIQATLIEFIYPQFESAKINELRETSNVQILDPAVVPSRKSRPPRKVIVVLSAVASVIATLIIVLLLEYWRKIPQNNVEEWEKINKIRQFIKRK